MKNKAIKIIVLAILSCGFATGNILADPTTENHIVKWNAFSLSPASTGERDRGDTYKTAPEPGIILLFGLGLAGLLGTVRLRRMQLS